MSRRTRRNAAQRNPARATRAAAAAEARAAEAARAEAARAESRRWWAAKLAAEEAAGWVISARNGVGAFGRDVFDVRVENAQVVRSLGRFTIAGPFHNLDTAYAAFEDWKAGPGGEAARRSSRAWNDFMR